MATHKCLVSSIEKDKDGYILRVREWDELTQRYTELWSMVRKKPFTVIIDGQLLEQIG